VEEEAEVRRAQVYDMEKHNLAVLNTSQPVIMQLSQGRAGSTVLGDLILHRCGLGFRV
jgi:hypothetical protein